MNTQLVRLMVVSLVLGIAVLLGGAPDTAYAGEQDRNPKNSETTIKRTS